VPPRTIGARPGLRGWAVGSTETAGGDPFSGAIDEELFTDYALTRSQIQAPTSGRFECGVDISVVSRLREQV